MATIQSEFFTVQNLEQFSKVICWQNLLPIMPMRGLRKAVEMAKGLKRNHSASFNAKVALVVISWE
jgi:hypothetical protein